VLRAWLGREDHAALLDLDDLEAQQHTDGRWRELAGGDRAQRAEPVELR